MIEFLPHINATLNLIATCLLITGFVMIKRGRESAHKRLMLSAFAVSMAFLACYLVYHANVGSKHFPADDYLPVFAWIYRLILFPHIILAATVPFLTVITIFLGLTDRREQHKKFARWTFPIWVYVSITGVLVYLFIYWLFPPLSETAWLVAG